LKYLDYSIFVMGIISDLCVGWKLYGTLSGLVLIFSIIIIGMTDSVGAVRMAIDAIVEEVWMAAIAAILVPFIALYQIIKPKS
jgi:hypothetical protein